MRAFIIFCLISVACADKLGYNYRPVGHSASGLSFTPSGSYGSPSYSIPSYASQGYSSEALPSYAPQGYGGQATNDVPSYAPQPELEKEFFTFSANDDDFSEPAASNQYSNTLKQGIRVIFIKGPENRGLENAAVGLAKHAAEQRTAIYVLTKQADLGDLANKLNTDFKFNNNKPEVHFVKYRTPEDAANAQKAIQDQYDSLGGPSQSYNGGIAPVLNFASKAPVAAPAFAASAPRRSYLPASIFKK